MQRTCGNCLFSEKGGETVVWCFGAPPTVTHAKKIEGGDEIAVQAPLMPKERRACGHHRYRFGPRGLFWKATGGP